MDNIRVNTTRFDTAFKQYLQYNKRSVKDIVTKVAFEVSKLASVSKIFTPQSVIKSSLEMVSRVSSTLRIADVIANKIAVTKTGKGLSGTDLTLAGDKYIRRAKSGSKFLAAQNLWSVKTLAPYVDKGRIGSTNNLKGRIVKGGAKPAEINWVTVSSIWNSASGGIKKWIGAPKTNTAKVQAVEERIYQGALNTKQADLQVYIDRKMNEGAKQFNNA